MRFRIDLNRSLLQKTTHTHTHTQPCQRHKLTSARRINAIAMTVMALIVFIHPTQAQYVPDTTALNAFIGNIQIKDSTRIHLRDSIAQARNLPIVDSSGSPTRYMYGFTLDSAVYFIPLNAYAASVSRTNKLHYQGGLGLNLNGQGMKIGLWDPGVAEANHTEFYSGRILSQSGGIAANHHTHIAGTLIARGVNGDAKGMAPDASIIDYNFLSTFETQEMAIEAKNGLLNSVHSTGVEAGWTGPNRWAGTPSIDPDEDWKFGFYDVIAQDWDSLTFLAPKYLIMKGAGNTRGYQGNGPQEPNGGSDGFDCIHTHANAKNILTIGAIDEPSGLGTFCLGSMWGPSDDGRIKPDLVAHGCDIFSTAIGGSYTTMSGTSMATPVVAGSLLLLQQHFMNLRNGWPPLASTIKALAIHTSTDIGPTGPDYKFGWGLLNTEEAVKAISNGRLNVYDSLRLTSGDTIRIPISYRVTDCNQQLKATIAWTDPPATPLDVTQSGINNTSPRLVNDLDLRIYPPAGAPVVDPWKLAGLSDPSANAVRDENHVDNVEQVLIENPSDGEYIVEITNTGHLRNGPQIFSLVVTGNEKLHMLSSTEGVTELNSQRKVDYLDPSPEYWQAVYESDGEIWYTESTNKGSSWYPEQLLSNGSGKSTQPSIFSVAGLGLVTWREGSTIHFGQVTPGISLDTCAQYAQWSYDFEKADLSQAVIPTVKEDATPVIAGLLTATQPTNEVSSFVVYETEEDVGGQITPGLAYLWFRGTTLITSGLIQGTSGDPDTPPVTPSIAFDKYKLFYNNQPEFLLSWREGVEILYTKLKITGTNPFSFSYLVSAMLVNDPPNDYPASGAPSTAPYRHEEAATYPTVPNDAAIAYRIDDQTSGYPAIQVALLDSLGGQPYHDIAASATTNDDVANPSLMSHLAYQDNPADNYDNLRCAYDYVDGSDTDVYVAEGNDGSFTSSQQIADAFHPAVIQLVTSGKALGLNTVEIASTYTQYEVVSTTTGLSKLHRYLDHPKPTGVSLHQNFPNPFSSETTIRYELHENTSATISVYDYLGRRIYTLLNAEHSAGVYQLSFDGSQLQTGSYLLRLSTPNGTVNRTVTVIR